jgi:porin
MLLATPRLRAAQCSKYEKPANIPGKLLLHHQHGSQLAGNAGGVEQQDMLKRLEARGIAISGGIVLEGFMNFRGGVRTHRAVGTSTVDLGMSLDTGRLVGWKGGRFYMDLEGHAGTNPSSELVGDLQVFDKQNAPSYLQVFEMWYQQRLISGRLRIKVGKVDANTEFSVIDYGLPFLNSATQVTPTLFVFPTTPEPMPSLNVFFAPRRSWYTGFGLYYSNRSAGVGNLSGSPQDSQPTNNGLFLIWETGLKWKGMSVFGGAGNLKMGLWEHTGTFTRFDNSTQRGTYGGYAIFDQTLWQPTGEPGSGRGLRTFLEYGGTQESLNAIDWHVGTGITWTGPLAARPDDMVGFSPQYAHLSRKAGLPFSYELAMELFYKFQIAPGADLMPDLQYIVHPGGRYADALVGTLRLELDLP